MSSAQPATSTSTPTSNRPESKSQPRGHKGNNDRRSKPQTQGQAQKSGKPEAGSSPVKDFAAERERRRLAEIARNVDEANKGLTDITLAALLALFVAGYPVSEEVLAVSSSDDSIAAELEVIRNAKAAYKVHGRKVNVAPGSYTANKLVTSEPALAMADGSNGFGLKLTDVGDALARRYITAMTSKGWRWPAPGIHGGARVSMNGVGNGGGRPRKPGAQDRKPRRDNDQWRGASAGAAA